MGRVKNDKECTKTEFIKRKAMENLERKTIKEMVKNKRRKRIRNGNGEYAVYSENEFNENDMMDKREINYEFKL